MLSDTLPDPDRSRESLEERLRALPRPPLPLELEARLLAAAPSRLPLLRRRWPIWISAAAALAAACMVAVFAWPRPDVPRAVTGPLAGGPAERVVAPPSHEYPSIAAWRQIRGLSDGDTTYTWPIDEIRPLRASPSIPAELLE
jgi:hypothetical protein